jgi:hypothetical protein
LEFSGSDPSHLRRVAQSQQELRSRQASASEVVLEMLPRYLRTDFRVWKSTQQALAGFYGANCFVHHDLPSRPTKHWRAPRVPGEERAYVKISCIGLPAALRPTTAVLPLLRKINGLEDDPRRMCSRRVVPRWMPSCFAIGADIPRREQRLVLEHLSKVSFRGVKVALCGEQEIDRFPACRWRGRFRCDGRLAGESSDIAFCRNRSIIAL